MDPEKLLLIGRLQHALQQPHSNTRGTVTSESPACQQGELRAPHIFNNTLKRDEAKLENH